MEEVWKVVYIASRQEKKVAVRLAQEGIEYFLPLYQKLSQWSDRKKWVELPLFNGYLFVKPTTLQRDKVLSLQGVVAFVRYNKEDAIVKQTEIEIIKQVLESGY
ncbi:MAG TPA: antitermination protein NusG, partial [Bacteroidetes bacterium]|nr:antitermination protein NusG [Bacteroidota bacterium]